MKTASVIFALAALGGLALAFMRILEAENPPTWMAILHGLVAATAVGSLLYAAAQYGLPPMGKAALATFVIAASVGLFLFINYQLTESLLPIPGIVLHGAFAVTGFGMLLAALNVRQYAHRFKR